MAIDKLDFPKTPIVIVGLGVTGLSCVKHFGNSVDVSVVDTRVVPPGLDMLRAKYPRIRFYSGALQPAMFESARMLVVSPGICINDPVFLPAKQRQVEIIGDIELFARCANAPIIAITGSNGKSTVTTLVEKMFCQANVNVKAGGNLGTPALDLLDDNAEVYVLELSSFQLETTTMLGAHIATVLNLSPDHLDRYATYQDYVNAKGKVYNGARIKVVNRDDTLAKGLATFDDIVSFGLDQPLDGQFGLIEIQDEVWLAKGNQKLVSTNSLLVAGKHNFANALAALAIGDAWGLPIGSMLETLKSFSGLEHRSQVVMENRGVQWINDSKGTNVGATIAAISGLDAPVILIAGGDGKGADFTPLREAVARKVKHAVLIGKDAARIGNLIENVVPVTYATDMQSAVGVAASVAAHGDVVLLSPACASLDMYANYQERGNSFIDAVKVIVGGENELD